MPELRLGLKAVIKPTPEQPERATRKPRNKLVIITNIVSQSVCAQGKTRGF